MSENTSNPIDLLINNPQPYAPESIDDALFSAAMKQADTWHLNRNVNYAKLWETEANPLILLICLKPWIWRQIPSLMVYG